MGVLKEEVWVNEKNEVVKYSLAYICHAVSAVDNGRVLGYDNAHGVHERHRMGMIESVLFTSYDLLLESFLKEVREWRERT